MSTLADLIRAHQANPRTLYVAPETDKTSQPGSYDQSASQRSPALDRRIEKLTARNVGQDRGLDPGDLDKIDDLEDLNDLLNGDDPDLPDPDDPEIPDPEDPDLPDPEDPDTPDLPVEPPVMGYGTAYALHSGSISKTQDGGAKWANFTGSPASPIGFSIIGDDAYVATASGVFYGDALSGWRELTLGDQNIQIAGFVNGGFEAKLSGWETIDGDSPWTGWIETIIPNEGSSYLGRDYVTYSDGEFTVAQSISFTPAEIAAMSEGTLSFSADVWGAGGSAELRIERYGYGELIFEDSDRLPGAWYSTPLTYLQVEYDGMPASMPSDARIYIHHDIDWGNSNHSKPLSDPNNRITVYMYVDIKFGGASSDPHYSSTPLWQNSVQAMAAVMRDGEFQEDYTAVLSGRNAAATGTITITFPKGWRYNIGFSQPFGAGSTANLGQSIDVPWGYGWRALASASSSEFTWNRVSANLSTPLSADSQVHCVIEATGSPADVYVDNCRLEIIRDSIDMEVHAIGGEYVAINKGLYKMSPAGLTLFRTMEFEPEGIDVSAGLIAWDSGDYCIYIEEEDATYTLAQPFLKVFSDPAGAIVFMSSGEIWRRRNDPDYPGWDTLGTLSGPIVDIVSTDGAYIALSDPAIDLGSLRTSRDLASWRIVSTTSYGNRVASLGMNVMTWTKGAPQLYWFDSSGWHTVGNLKAGIIDISAG